MPPTTTSYRTIKADLLTRIQAGEFPPGTRLPDEIDLAERFGVARTTVARAMRELVDDGLIERRRKAGTRVRLAPLRQARVKIPLVRDEIGAVATFRDCTVVQGLPKTRSGKILRKTMRQIADGQDDVAVPSTIEDPAVLDALAPFLRGEK